MLAFVAAVVAVLCLPVRLRLHARSAPSRVARVELGLFGGLLPWIVVVDTERPKKPKAKAKPKEEKKRKKKRRGKGRAGLWRALPGLFRGLLRPVRVERFEIDCTFGLGDPADTGQLFGLGGIDGDNPGMGIGAALHFRVQHSGQLHV